MTDPWERLHSAAVEALDWLWYGLAKEGRESAVLAPLARHPNAAAWLAGCMAMSARCIPRKLGAMLAGWIDDPEQSGLLPEMLDNERKVFAEDSLTANSVGEDIMFAATRWARRTAGKQRETGIAVLAAMIGDALEGTPWNTVHWAVANLRGATGGQHPMLDRLRTATDEQLGAQRLLRDAAKALQSGDEARLNRFNSAPSPLCELSPDDPNYAMACELWQAAEAAEATVR